MADPFAPLKVLVVTTPSWRDTAGFVADFRRGNPAAVAIQDGPGVAPFVLAQVGGGVDGLALQVLLESSGDVTVWRRADSRKARRPGS